MGNEKEVNPIEKVDMVIAYISDCILELDSTNPIHISEMASALATLLNARTAAVLVMRCGRQ